MPVNRKNTAVKQIAVTLLLIAVNTVVFFYHSVRFNAQSGDISISAYMLEHGANFYPRVVAGEYYRLFTCMFLHFDATHLFGNMLSLYAIGSVIEKAFGKISFTAIYMISGIGASIVSGLYHMAMGEMAVCAGASGAIFGLAGALICLALLKQTERYGINSRRVPAAIIITLILSSASRDGLVDAAAHVGGLVIGFAVSLLIVFIHSQRHKPRGE